MRDPLLTEGCELDAVILSEVAAHHDHTDPEKVHVDHAEEVVEGEPRAAPAAAQQPTRPWKALQP
eukprot:6981731-Alexandrium_andersonii.AAC.1